MIAHTVSFEPQRWLCLFGLAERWKVQFADGVLQVQTQGPALSLSVLDVTASATRGWFWSRVLLQHGDHSLLLDGLLHEKAELLVTTLTQQRKEAQGRLESLLKADRAQLEPLYREVGAQISAQRYLAARDRHRIEQLVAAHAEVIDAAYVRARSPYAAALSDAPLLARITAPLQTLARHSARVLAEHNQRFVEQELQRWRTFFDHCEERPLTDEQARAAITFEENTLLVAAAGSGKTSTVVGKVAYALAKGIAQPEEILCLAFNRKAANEIAERLETRLAAMRHPDCPIDSSIKARIGSVLDSGAMRIQACTFHSLGRQIVCDVAGSSIGVSPDGETSQRLKRAIERCQRDPNFASNWLLLQAVARFARPADSRFRSEADYLEYLRGMWRQRKFAKKGDDTGILSLGSTKLLRSFEEVAISNWLYLMGVPFEYEATFEEGAALLCPGTAWRPDFTYRVSDAQGERIVVHEHFALDSEGRAPAFFRDPAGYVQQAQAKQAALRQLDVRHFWTTSSEYLDGTLFVKLEERLRVAGVRFQPRDADEVLVRLEQIGQLPDNELIGRAVSQIRQNGWDRATLEARVAQQPEPRRARLFLDVVWPVAEAVKELLVEDQRLDYDEMIRRALVHLREQRGQLPYRFILADEFQDMAPGRAELVQQLLNARDDSLFFAVGDDWQAINRFAGSDLRFFNNFGDSFNRRAGASHRCDLTQTFRSNQGIADVAKQFILENRSQLAKEVVALDKTSNGVIDVCFYQKDSEVLDRVEATLHRWVSSHVGNEKPKVFLLGRYGPTRVAGLSKKEIEELDQRWSDRVELVQTSDDRPPTMYLTMHGSKGLQADYVLILGLFSAAHDWFCFPSEREDDPLLQLVMPPKEAIADADERRLFYVALTRAKRQVVLLAHESRPSRYVLELLSRHGDGKLLCDGTSDLRAVCPACRRSVVCLRHNRESHAPFYACGDKDGCGATWSRSPNAASGPASHASGIVNRSRFAPKPKRGYGGKTTARRT